MNRYKFRAWHKSQKRMFEVYGLGQDFITEKTMDGVDPGNNCFNGDELKDIVVMQWTGINDKKGNPIFEGDIVTFSTRRYHLGYDKGLQTIKFKSQVVWEDGCFCVSEKQENDTPLYAHDKSTDNPDGYEIIGNIHQQGDIKL